VLVLTSTAYFMVILDTGALFAALPGCNVTCTQTSRPCSGLSTPTALHLPLGYSPLSRSEIGLAGVGSSTWA
jgi:hypothetical protein